MANHILNTYEFHLFDYLLILNIEISDVIQVRLHRDTEKILDKLTDGLLFLRNILILSFW